MSFTSLIISFVGLVMFIFGVRLAYLENERVKALLMKKVGEPTKLFNQLEWGWRDFKKPLLYFVLIILGFYLMTFDIENIHQLLKERS